MYCPAMIRRRRSERSTRFSLRAAAVMFSGAAAVLLGIGGDTRACGPFFPNSIVRSDEWLTSAPVADFYLELKRVGVKGPRGFEAKLGDAGPYKQTAAVAQSDLESALRDTSMAEADRKQLLEQHKKYVDVLQDRAALRDNKSYQVPEEKGRYDFPAFPEGLPREFDLYLRGATAYHKGEIVAALESWSELLRLPPSQRKWRTTWAVYMIGRTCVGINAAQADACLEQVRVLSRAGFSDNLGLGVASLGWQAKAKLDLKQYEAAISLYLMQVDLGGLYAVESLQDVMRVVFRGDAALLSRFAADPVSRGVVTAFLLARGGRFGPSVKSEHVQRWLSEMERLGIRDAAGAGRFAWIAYQANDLANADRWLVRADPKSAMTQWVRAKLLLRAGKVDAGIEALAAASKGFPADETWDTSRWGDRIEEMESGIRPRTEAMAELAALKLARGQYTAALDLIMHSGRYWEDAAEIAERVLTADELIGFVDAKYPQASKALVKDSFGRAVDRSAGDGLRDLLARRLVRIGRWKDARRYFDSGMQRVLDEYISAIRTGHDSSRPRSERVEAFWSAAQIACNSGMELMGTSLEPDNADWGGSYGAVAEDENHPKAKQPEAKNTSLLAPSADETRRVEKSVAQIEPFRRFHYRYVAADHAWAAAELMPDDDVKTADVLATAGKWLANRDPKGADRFYKALVRRCPNTELGRKADKLRWFPGLNEKTPK